MNTCTHTPRAPVRKQTQVLEAFKLKKINPGDRISHVYIRTGDNEANGAGIVNRQDTMVHESGVNSLKKRGYIPGRRERGAI